MLFISLFWYFYCCPLANDRYLGILNTPIVDLLQ